LGFIEAEGCFSISLLSNSSAFRIRFILAQKWEINKQILDHFLTMLSTGQPKLIGAVVPHSVEKVWELRINGLKNCEIFLNYLDSCVFPMRTKKIRSLELFKLIYLKLMQGEHLDEIKRNELVELSKQINQVLPIGKKEMVGQRP